MPTNDERREIAARLRRLDAKITNRNTLEQAVDKFMKAACGNIPFSPIRRSVRNLCGLANMLADLIEPAPERTCHAIYDGDDSGHEFAGKSWHCSVCGHEMDEYEAKCGVYCIKCGAKVVDE